MKHECQGIKDIWFKAILILKLCFNCIHNVLKIIKKKRTT